MTYDELIREDAELFLQEMLSGSFVATEACYVAARLHVHRSVQPRLEVWSALCDMIVPIAQTRVAEYIAQAPDQFDATICAFCGTPVVLFEEFGRFRAEHWNPASHGEVYNFCSSLHRFEHAAVVRLWDMLTGGCSVYFHEYRNHGLIDGATRRWVCQKCGNIKDVMID